MRNLLLALALVGALLSFSPFSANAAKAANCYGALRNCSQSCREVCNNFPGITECCMTGCNIGYLMC